MPLVLAIEPDLRQAAIVTRIVREKVRADVAVVDSRDAALEAIRAAVPDVLLLSTLLSPRDEDELIAHVRTLDQAQHLQTHTIPQLASSGGSAHATGGGEHRGARGLFAAFMGRKTEAVPSGCDPDLFAEEIRSYLRQASEKKRELQELAASGQAPASAPPPAAAFARAATTADDDFAPASPPAESSWASPFEWKPAAAPPPNRSSLIVDQRILDPESPIPDPIPNPIPDPVADPVPDPILAPVPSPPRRPLEQVNLWRDSGFTIRDQRFADEGLRMNDSMLSADVAVVTRATGCRVRRVRVAAAAA